LRDKKVVERRRNDKKEEYKKEMLKEGKREESINKSGGVGCSFVTKDDHRWIWSRLSLCENSIQRRRFYFLSPAVEK
jgi:hypothetical protein